MAFCQLKHPLYHCTHPHSCSNWHYMEDTSFPRFLHQTQSFAFPAESQLTKNQITLGSFDTLPFFELITKGNCTCGNFTNSYFKNKRSVSPVRDTEHRRNAYADDTHHCYNMDRSAPVYTSRSLRRLSDRQRTRSGGSGGETGEKSWWENIQKKADRVKLHTQELHTNITDCDATQFEWWTPTFRRNPLLPTSG